MLRQLRSEPLVTIMVRVSLAVQLCVVGSGLAPVNTRAPIWSNVTFDAFALVPKVAGWSGVTPPSAAPCWCRVARGPSRVYHRLDLARLCFNAPRSLYSRLRLGVDSQLNQRMLPPLVSHALGRSPARSLLCVSSLHALWLGMNFVTMSGVSIMPATRPYGYNTNISAPTWSIPPPSGCLRNALERINSPAHSAWL